MNPDDRSDMYIVIDGCSVRMDHANMLARDSVKHSRQTATLVLSCLSPGQSLDYLLLFGNDPVDVYCQKMTDHDTRLARRAVCQPK